jgi:mRNA-degrading endonuclease RelE of RelBE toxin-antitoxin system
VPVSAKHSANSCQGNFIDRAIEARLATEPEKYGTRLRRSLLGLWKLRVGDYRVVFELQAGRVRVWAIVHRKRV